MRELTPRQKGIILGVSGMLLVSLDSLGFRLTEVGPWDNAFWVGVFIFIAMSILVPVRTGQSLFSIARQDGPIDLVSAALQAVSTGFFILSLANTEVSNVVAIVAAVPLLTALLAHYFIREKTPLRVWLAIGTAFAGILVIVGGSLGDGSITGDLYALVAITGFASNLTLWRKYPDINRQVIIGLGGLLIAIAAVIPADPLSVGWRALLILAVLGSITGPLGRVSVATATRFLPAAQVALFTPVETVAATLWAALFLSELPSATTIIGGLIVIVAVAFGVARQEDTESVAATPV